MEFDVSSIDLKDLLRALIANAKPKGLGEAEYNWRRSRKENTDSISDKEMNEFFKNFHEELEGGQRIVDYYMGMPIKLDLAKKPSGRIVTSSLGYDRAHGRYAFLKVLLTYFHADDILILKKGYPQYYTFEETPFVKKANDALRKLVSKSLKTQTSNGASWKIDITHPSYQLFQV